MTTLRQHCRMDRFADKRQELFNAMYNDAGPAPSFRAACSGLAMLVAKLVASRHPEQGNRVTEHQAHLLASIAAACELTIYSLEDEQE